LRHNLNPPRHTRWANIENTLYSGKRHVIWLAGKRHFDYRILRVALCHADGLPASKSGARGYGFV
jgi:hypothetical protein